MVERLLTQIGLEQGMVHSFEENIWVEVIQKMDDIYADLVHYQVELEEKNTQLEQAYGELKQAHQALQSTQQQLIQSEKMASLGRLVAGVAHELNNPISFVFANMHALLGYEQRFQRYLAAIHSNRLSVEERDALRKELRIDRLMQDIRPLLEGSMEGAERVSEIVKNLRQFSTPASQQARAFDVVALVQRSVQWLTRASHNKLDVLSTAPSELVIHNYEGYVYQVLVNLIQNALDAMETVADRRLQWCIVPVAKQVEISIWDTGMGIADADLQRLFDPFFTTKSVGKGTGLGLYISYGLVTEYCRGTLSAENYYREGYHGAVFRLRLPLQV